MVITKDEIVPVRSSEDIVRVRQAVRNWAIDLGFGLVDQTKLVTAASELARNTVNYGGGGTVRMGPSTMQPTRACSSSSRMTAPALPTSSWRCRMAIQPGTAWVWAWVVPGGWRTSSRSCPIRERGHEYVSSGGHERSVETRTSEKDVGSTGNRDQPGGGGTSRRHGAR
jgi:hypothetical protein